MSGSAQRSSHIEFNNTIKINTTGQASNAMNASNILRTVQKRQLYKPQSSQFARHADRSSSDSVIKVEDDDSQVSHEFQARDHEMIHDEQISTLPHPIQPVKGENETEPDPTFYSHQNSE